MIERSFVDTSWPRTVLWSRGEGCRELATLLASDRAAQIDRDPVESCVALRADLAVMAKLGSFDLVPIVAPSSFDPSSVSSVVAAVGPGPHSRLAAAIASRLAARLDVPGEAVCAVRPGQPRAPARALLNDIAGPAGLAGRVVETVGPAGLLDEVQPTPLLVLGAPGGSWINRQFLGPGARLKSQAPAGAVVVRDAPRRAFHIMGEPSGLSPYLRVGDAASLLTAPVTPVAEEGRLVGIVRVEGLVDVDPTAPIADVMEDAPFIDVSDTLEMIAELSEFFEGSPIPVVDRNGMLTGLVDPAQLG